MITNREDTRCDACGLIVHKGQAMLEGSGRSLYCSPDCFDKGEQEIDPLEGQVDEADYEE